MLKKDIHNHILCILLLITCYIMFLSAHNFCHYSLMPETNLRYIVKELVVISTKILSGCCIIIYTSIYTVYCCNRFVCCLLCLLADSTGNCLQKMQKQRLITMLEQSVCVHYYYIGAWVQAINIVDVCAIKSLIQRQYYYYYFYYYYYYYIYLSKETLVSSSVNTMMDQDL